MAVGDAGVGDEFTLPQISRFKAYDDGNYRWTADASAEFEKRLTENFDIAIGAALVEEDKTATEKRSFGLSNTEITAKYQFLQNDTHELLLAASLGVEIGGSGAEHSGADDYSTFSPALHFSKGLGDMPASLSFLKPVEITGEFGASFAADRFDDNGERNADQLNYGMTLQYSIPYLVKNGGGAGLPAFLADVTPIVEFAMETPVNGDERFTTGTIQPGLLWSVDEGVQFGIEAIVPVTSRTGRGIGAVAQLHIYMDELMPDSALGKPIWY